MYIIYISLYICVFMGKLFDTERKEPLSLSTGTRPDKPLCIAHLYEIRKMNIPVQPARATHTAHTHINT